MIAMIVLLVLVGAVTAVVLDSIAGGGEAGYRRARLGGRQGVERWASPLRGREWGVPRGKRTLR